MLKLFLCSVLGHSWWHVLTVRPFFIFSSVIRFFRFDEIMVGCWGLLQIHWYPMYAFMFTWIFFSMGLLICFLAYVPLFSSFELKNITRHVSAKSTRFCLFLFARPPKLTFFSPLPTRFTTERSVQKTTPRTIPSNTDMDFRMLRVCT